MLTARLKQFLVFFYLFFPTYTYAGSGVSVFLSGDVGDLFFGGDFSIKKSIRDGCPFWDLILTHCPIHRSSDSLNPVDKRRKTDGRYMSMVLHEAYMDIVSNEGVTVSMVLKTDEELGGKQLTSVKITGKAGEAEFDVTGYGCHLSHKKGLSLSTIEAVVLDCYAHYASHFDDKQCGKYREVLDCLFDGYQLGVELWWGNNTVSLMSRYELNEEVVNNGYFIEFSRSRNCRVYLGEETKGWVNISNYQDKRFLCFQTQGSTSSVKKRFEDAVFPLDKNLALKLGRQVKNKKAHNLKYPNHKVTNKMLGPGCEKYILSCNLYACLYSLYSTLSINAMKEKANRGRDFKKGKKAEGCMVLRSPEYGDMVAERVDQYILARALKGDCIKGEAEASALKIIAKSWGILYQNPYTKGAAFKFDILNWLNHNVALPDDLVSLSRPYLKLSKQQEKNWEKLKSVYNQRKESGRWYFRNNGVNSFPSQRLGINITDLYNYLSWLVEKGYLENNQLGREEFVEHICQGQEDGDPIVAAGEYTAAFRFSLSKKQGVGIDWQLPILKLVNTMLSDLVIQLVDESGSEITFCHWIIGLVDAAKDRWLMKDEVDSQAGIIEIKPGDFYVGIRDRKVRAEEKLAELDRGNLFLEERVSEKNRRLGDLEEELEEANGELIFVKNEKDKIKKGFEDIKEKKRKLEQEMMGKNKKIADLEKKVKESESTIASHIEIISRLSADLSSKKSIEDSYNSLKAKYNQLVARLKSRQEKSLQSRAEDNLSLHGTQLSNTGAMHFSSGSHQLIQNVNIVNVNSCTLNQGGRPYSASQSYPVNWGQRQAPIYNSYSGTAVAAPESYSLEGSSSSYWEKDIEGMPDGIQTSLDWISEESIPSSQSQIPVQSLPSGEQLPIGGCQMIPDSFQRRSDKVNQTSNPNLWW